MPHYLTFALEREKGFYAFHPCPGSSCFNDSRHAIQWLSSDQNTRFFFFYSAPKGKTCLSLDIYALPQQGFSPHGRDFEREQQRSALSGRCQPYPKRHSPRSWNSSSANSEKTLEPR